MSCNQNKRNGGILACACACMYMYTYVHAYSARARVFVEYIFSFAFRASLFLARCSIGLNEIKVSLLTIIHNSQKLYLIAFVFSTETRNLLHRTRWEKD